MANRPSKLKIFEQKVTEGHYKSRRSAMAGLKRTVLKKTQRIKARTFIEEHFTEHPVETESKAATPKVSGGRFLVAFAKLCKDEKQAHKIRGLLVLALEAHYDLTLLIQALDRVFDDGASGGALAPIENQPGLFRQSNTGKIINIRDF